VAAVQKRFRLLGSRLVLPFQFVLRKTVERSSGKKGMAEHRRLDRSRACLCAVESRKRACERLAVQDVLLQLHAGKTGETFRGILPTTPRHMGVPLVK